MRSRIFTTGLIFLIAFTLLKGFIASSSLYHAQAQTNNSSASIKSAPIELDIDSIYIPCEDPSLPFCVPYPASIPLHPDPAHLDHEMGLLGEGFPPNTDIYIVGCIHSSTGIKCTTGDQNLDTLLNNIPGGNQMGPDPSHQFKALQNPMRSDADGNLPTIIVRSFTPDSTYHFFYAYYLTDSSQPAQEINSKTDLPIEFKTINQTDIALITVTPIPTKPPVRRRPFIRRMIAQDPKGRLFDSQSLEPITDAEVSLLDNTKKLFQYQNLVNPQKVMINGEFNFWVPNGIYYLDIEKPPGFSWPLNLDRVHPNFRRAYFCDPDVKKSDNNPAILYLETYAIIEFNKLVHCDVPLDPGVNPPTHRPVQTVNYGYYKSADSQTIIYSGKITHPLSNVIFKAKSTMADIANVNADRLGYWNIVLPINQLPKKNNGVADQIEIEYKKFDLVNNVYLNNTDKAQLVFEPILNYIEGYAYNLNGQITPLAKIGIHQLNTEKVNYLTTADQHGFFRIPSQYLPSFAFEIVILPKDSQQPITYTPSQFLETNADYLNQTQLDLLTTINKNVLTDITYTQKDIGKNTNSLPSLTPSQSQSSSKSVFIRLVAILIVLFLITLIFILSYFYKKTRLADS